MEDIKVIVVDDDTDLGDLVTSCLMSEGYKVHYQTTLTGIENIIDAFQPSILVLDVEIGNDDAVTRSKNILQKYPLLPIIFISSHIETQDVTRGIMAGGVGYIRKPFDMEELCAYIQRFALPNISDDERKIGSYTLDIKTRELSLNGAVIKQLSRLEFNVLMVLLDNANEIVRHEAIAEKVWGKDYRDIEHTLNNVISKLRKLFSETYSLEIQTIKDVGYKLKV